MKMSINASVWKTPQYISIDRSYFYCIFTTHMTSISDKKSDQMSLENFIILVSIFKSVGIFGFSKQILAGNLSRLVEMKMDFLM